MAKKKTVMAATGAAAAGKGAAAATKLAVAASAAGTQARDQASDLGDRLAPVVGDARDRLAPVVSDARDRLAPVVEDARDRLAPVVDDARERLVDFTGTVATRIDDLTGTVSERLDDLTGTVATRLDDALPDRATPSVVKQRVAADHRRRNWLLQALFVLGLGTVAAAVTRRLTGGGSEPTWRSTTDQPSRTPAGAPATNATASTSEGSAGRAAAATAGESADGLIAGDDHASGNVPGDVTNDAGEIGPVETSADVAGGTPEEVAADATDTPHPVTTPDKPAQKVVID